ncbi:MAG: SUMF1/EgtB/PvdO family nonheme iron enzyme [Chloroflexota bacterium]
MFNTKVQTLYLLTSVILILFLNGGVIQSSADETEREAGTIRVDEHGIEQVWVSAGSFLAGSTETQADDAYQTCLAIYPGMCLLHEYTSELYQREVTLTYGFWIDRYEVTNEAYDAFVRDGGYSNEDYWTEAGWRWKGNRTAPNDADCPNDLLEPDMPRTCITWYEADAYARWRGGRLPNEAEWERAARGEEGFLYPWGNDFDGTRLNYCDALCANVWRDDPFDDGFARLAPVGSYEDGQSWVGAYDMAGNVWEWTDDWFLDVYHQSESAIDPVAPERGIEKVLRGGSWNMPYIFSRTAYRDGVLPDSWSGIIGFRMVTLEPDR